MANVYHLSTGYMSSQYHLVFHDLFETVFNIGNDSLLFYICNCFFDYDCEFYDDEFMSDDPLVYHPPDESNPEHLC